MTILEALERAKNLAKLQKASLAALAERTQASLGDANSVPAVNERLVAEHVAPVHYSALERVEFDATACVKNKILVTDAQLSAAGHAAAAYRLMRSRILHRIKAGNWTCIGITSPGPGEGKTVTVLNLAISIARDRQRMVYLLDLDMRNPSVWDRLGCRPKYQLTQYFTEGLAPEQVLYDTSVENLVIGGACDSIQGASELLSSTQIDDLLQYVRRRSPGGLVLVDLPPVPSTDEALIVAPRTDAFYLIVSEGVTRRDGLARAIDLLSDFTVAGIILNRSREKLGAEYYGY